MFKVVIGLAVLLALSGLSLFIGVIDLRPGAVLQDREALELIVVSRAPRLFAVLITGASLAVAGTIMQMLVRNRFVEPMTVGSGEGAALGILLVTLFAPSAPLFTKIMMASATAFLSTAGFLAISRRLPPAQPYMVALVGLVYGGVIGAGVTFVAYQNDFLQMIAVWVTGEFSGVLQGRYETLWLAALAAVLCFLAADQFSIVGLGHSASINLGLNYRQVMLFGLLAVSLVSALTVVSVGIIPFVGLVVPNIVSRMMGDNLRRTLPMIAMMGAGLVLVADILGRVLRYPFEIPSATVLGVVGATVFIWILTARRVMHRRRLIVLAALFVVAAIAYMTIGARGNWGFVLEFRGAKLVALCLVAVSLSTSTVLFQTITQNRLLTPSIMGFDELFVLILTLGVFVFGMADYLVVTSWIQFFVSLVLMTGASLLLFGTLLLQERPDLMRMILTGLVLTVLFRSLRTLLVRMLDPNEFSVVQVSSYARFHQIETGLLSIAAVTIGAALIAAWRMRHRLDVLSLGREAALNLGENMRRGTLEVLFLISVLVSVATALVGPTAFLGLLVVSIAHAITPTGRHTVLLCSAGLVSAITLVGGQTLLERVFGLVTPLTVVIDIAGGVLFLFLVMKGLKR